jgi:flavin-dependent dehydrogenase
MNSDVAIVGGGPGGAAAAMFLAQHGISSTIVERDSFPRYHIGESMSGECGALLRTLGLESKMLQGGYPIKRGLTVYGPTGNPWYVPVMARTPENELVPQFTWQVRRSDFDQMMLNEALARGATLVRGNATMPLMDDDGAVQGVRVELADGPVENIRAEVVVDATGQRTWLARLGGITGPKVLGRYCRQIAVFSQVAGAVREPGERHGDTEIYYQRRDHWAWFIPIDDEIVSVGVVIPGDYFAAKQETKRDFLLRELRELNPKLSERVSEIELVEETRAIPDYSYQLSDFTGRGFLCIGDAHRFIDPIFSFGVYISIKEAQLAADAIKAYLEGSGRDDAKPFAAHERRVERGLDALQDLIDAFWEEPFAFAFLVHRKRREDMLDLFAGRIYGEEMSPGHRELRAVAERARASVSTR